MLYLVYLLFAGFVITRFGRAISPSRALPVWLVLFALAIAVVWPSALLPVAELFGIQLVSNMVFATMILFLLVEFLASAKEQTRSQRQLRKLVARLAAKEFHPPPRSTVTRTLVVVPAYNESGNIAAVVQQLEQLRATMGESLDVLVVDDGSEDDTAGVARKAARGGVFVVSHTVNCGVGGVLITGFTAALDNDYDYVVQCDADGQHPVERIPALVERAVLGKLDVVVGSRFFEQGGTDESTTGLRRVGGWLIALALATFGSRARVTDPTSGFRVYSRTAAALLASRMPDEYPEPEAIALCAIHRLSLGEMQVSMSPRLAGASSISGWKSAMFMVKVMTALLSFRVRHALGRAA
jgi:hypothetical protein